MEDPSKVFVHVALGFHVEFTLPEAVSFSASKKSSLKRAAEKLKEREAEVNADLASAVSMVEELRTLAAAEEEKEMR